MYVLVQHSFSFPHELQLLSQSGADELTFAGLPSLFYLQEISQLPLDSLFRAPNPLSAFFSKYCPRHDCITYLDPKS
ncbi:hypothetical protein AV530_017611 [Patagioenas fasciata monilis]|uniref:Uncharacterized protein n=1 Tax=Patagioenas fasciata monilis TaxID=372326 RepID=A0A1V4J9E0_PATFA|nr:hypothetical protein AV530_017611 [Patagioenas fasciata monilis]